MTLDDILQKPEEEFNLTEAMLVLAKEAAPAVNNDFDIQQYSAKINQMAAELKPRIDGKQPEEIISEINKYLFQEQGFEFNSNFFLNKVLDEKKGSCEGLSSLYLALAEQLKLPIYGSNSPDHIMVRWDDGKLLRNIETTSEGAEYDDLAYEIRYDIPQESIDRGIYLKNLSKKEVIATLLGDRGSAYGNKEDLCKAISDYNKALSLNPNDAETYNNRGVIYSRKGEFDAAISDYNRAIALNPNHEKAYNNRGTAYIKKEDIDAAILDFNKALELYPDYTIARQNLELTKEFVAKLSQLKQPEKSFWKNILRCKNGA